MLVFYYIMSECYSLVLICKSVADLREPKSPSPPPMAHQST